MNVWGTEDVWRRKKNVNYCIFGESHGKCIENDQLHEACGRV